MQKKIICKKKKLNSRHILVQRVIQNMFVIAVYLPFFFFSEYKSCICFCFYRVTFLALTYELWSFQMLSFMDFMIQFLLHLCSLHWHKDGYHLLKYMKQKTCFLALHDFQLTFFFFFFTLFLSLSLSRNRREGIHHKIRKGRW